MTTHERFWAKVRRGADDGCWEWLAAKGKRWGYGQFRLDGSMRTAHRVAWELHHGRKPGVMSVLHRCDNPPCCNPAHLFLGTHAENMADRGAKGRSRGPQGEMHGRSKFTADEVRAIRLQHVNGATIKGLAREHGVAASGMWRLIRGLSWRCVT